MREDSANQHCGNCGQEYHPSRLRVGPDLGEQSTRSTPNDLCPECAPDCRRPLHTDTLPEAADYLRHNENLRETFRSALSDPCLYYPGAGKDVDPALLFANSGAVSTVVYIDYLADSFFQNFPTVFEEFERNSGQMEFYDPEVHDYAECPVWRAQDKGTIAAEDLGFSSRDAFYPNTHTWGRRENEDQSEKSIIGKWVRFHDTRGISRPLMFLYFFTEAIQTYINLWGIRDQAPLAVVVQNHGKGCLWTPFHSDCLLYAAATRLPKYLYVGNLGSKPWPGYRQISRPRTDHRSMHHSERALFQAKTPFAINPNSPLTHWNRRSRSINSKRYPDFNVFKLLAPNFFRCLSTHNPKT